jgi:hypothetical protein
MEERRMDMRKLSIGSIIQIMVMLTAIIGYGVWIGKIDSRVTSAEALGQENKVSLVSIQDDTNDQKVQMARLEANTLNILSTLDEIKRTITIKY